MFNKIWYPEESLITISRFGITILLVLALLFRSVVRFEVLLVLFALMFLLGAVIKVRGAMTLELDTEGVEQAEAMRLNKKRIVTAIGIAMTVLLFAAGWLFRDHLYPVLPVVVVSLLMLLLGIMGLTPKNITITASIAIVLAVLVAGIVFTWKMAAITGAIPLLIFFPESLASSIRTDRLLKGDLEAKPAPSA